MNNPLLICMTPIRNEGWVLHAFLKATSLWADHIIIADQMSTDGSREIALSYPKVILIDNNNPNFNEAERQKLLIDSARQIEGDKILFGLDADEILSANYIETDDWQNILNSKPGDVFWFKWAEICPDQIHYWESEKTYYPWVFHDDGIEPHGNYVRNMHSMRIPYPIEEKQMFYVNDFKILHLAFLNPIRIQAKRRFYTFVDWELNKRSTVKLFRSYSIHIKKDPIYDLPNIFLYNKPEFDFSIFDLVEINKKKFWFDDYINERIIKLPSKKIRRLTIWDKDFLKEYKIKDTRNLIVKLFHHYLKFTQNRSNLKIVIIIDRILIKLGL